MARTAHAFVLGTAIAMLLSVSGCGLFSDATITEMTPGISAMMDKLECWLTIEFKRYPEDIRLRDVKVVFSSMALFEDQTFGWPFIAENDQIAQGLGKGYAPNGASRGDQKPPLKVKIKVNYPLRARPRIELEGLETISLAATLYWGGKKQDSASRSIEHAYRREKAK